MNFKDRLPFFPSRLVNNDMPVEQIVMAATNRPDVLDSALLRPGRTLRKNKEKIDMHDFEGAEDIILMGAVKEETISDTEKRITAYHEAGHTLTSWVLPGADPIYKGNETRKGFPGAIISSILNQWS